MVAGKQTASEYVAEWRKSTVEIAAEFGGDAVAAANAYAIQLETEFTRERLKEFVETGGRLPDFALSARIPTPSAVNRAPKPRGTHDGGAERVIGTGEHMERERMLTIQPL